jgi:hypothetical protein
MDEPTKARQRRFLTLAVLFITICYQYTTVLMTSKSTKQAQTTEGDGEKDKSERAVWKQRETTEFLNFLKTKNSEITDGGQFKTIHLQCCCNSHSPIPGSWPDQNRRNVQNEVGIGMSLHVPYLDLM